MYALLRKRLDEFFGGHDQAGYVLQAVTTAIIILTILFLLDAAAHPDRCPVHFLHGLLTWIPGVE